MLSELIKMARFNYGVCWLLVLTIWTYSLSLTAVAKPHKRQPLTIKLCQDLGYNTTVFPNFLRQRTQKIANLELDQFLPLVRIKCSKDLVLFLCSMYAPIYSAVLMKYIPPCRSLCESAKNGCDNVMREFGYVWPEDLACDKLPKSTPNTICVASQYKNATGNNGPQARKPARSNKRRYKKNKKQRNGKPKQVRNGSRKSSCEAVKLPLCTGQGYNMTAFPNLLGHLKQAEAGLEVRQFVPLVRANCSRDLPFFLCSLYAPPCTVLESPLPPCRSLCESAKSGCKGLLRRVGIPWPDSLDCDNLPSFSSSQMCIGAGGKVTSNVSPSANTVLSKNERKKRKRKNKKRKKNRRNRKNRKNRKNKNRKNRKRRPRMMRKKRKNTKIRKLSGEKQD